MVDQSVDNSYINPAFLKETNDYNIQVDELHHKPITYSWYRINAFAKPETGPFKGKHRLKEEKQILFDVTGICRPGELIAIMGASGAGKTTLLNVLTSKTGNSLRVEGDLCLDGEKMSLNKLTSSSAYVQQEDLFIGTMTVREQLNFQAMLRMDRHIKEERRMERVAEVISEMGLTKCQNTLIGIPGRIKGISGGETKRLAFACEVLTDPPLMFCDEPTSGLDSFMALTIVSAMKEITSKGKSIISTIHQPSSEVFALFDRVLLISEGRLAYLGTTVDALAFFRSLGKICPKKYNPADFFIATLAIRPEHEVECSKFVHKTCDTFRDSEEMKAIEEDVIQNMPQEKLSKDSDMMQKISPYKASWGTQFAELAKRSMLEMAREPMLLQIKIYQTVLVGLLIGLIYLDTSGGYYNQNSIQNINGCLFLIVTNLSFQYAFGVVNTFCAQLPIFLREHGNGMYRTDNFYLTKNLAELPTSIFLPAIYLLIVYFMVNMYRDVSTFFLMVLVLILVSNVALSFGYLISCIAKNFRMALALSAPMLIPFMLFGGFFLKSDTVPVYFIWLQYISWFNYGNEAMIICQWRNVDFIDGCENVEIGSVSPCHRNGTELIHYLGYDENHLWYDMGLLVALLVLFRTLAYFSLLRRSYFGI